MISSFGIVPCNTRLNAINTHGRYGAVNTNRPKKLNLVSGFLLDHIYTRLLLRAEPRNSIERKGAAAMRIVEAKRSSQEKFAAEPPEASSRRREYRWRKKTWKRRSRERGPK